METLKKLNTIGTLQKLPRKKYNELIKNYSYPINEFKYIPTKYGYKTIVILFDHTWEEFILFLPEK